MEIGRLGLEVFQVFIIVVLSCMLRVLKGIETIIAIDEYTIKNQNPEIQDCLAKKIATLANSITLFPAVTPSTGTTVPVVSWPIPPPGTAGSPHFDNSNMTEFLERYTELYKDHHLSNLQTLNCLPCYYKPAIGQYIKSILE